MKFVSLLLLLLCCSQAAAQACSYGELRLMPNSTAQIHITGSVEICYLNGRWEPVLSNQWDDQDAEVACNQLGFANDGATAYYHTESYIYRGLSFSCNGSESNLTDCQFTYSGRNGYSAGIKCLFHRPCPLQISLHRCNSTYVSFSWTGCSRDKVAPALEYLVNCADYMQIQQSTSQAVHGLRPNKQYSCYVYGIDSLGRLGEDTSFSFRTNQIAPQFAPYDFNYVFMSSRSISLTWKPPPMDDRISTITQYRIQYRCQTISTCSTIRTYYAPAQQSLTYAVSSLLSGEEYTFYIVACVGHLCGNTRSSLTVNVPSRVSGFAVRSTTASTAQLSWSRPNGGTRYYIIEATDRNTSVSETHYIANPATTLTDIYSLHPYHHYEFSIAVYTVVKGPLESQTVRMPQAVPTGGPHVVNCKVLNLTALDMKWTEPHHLEQNGPIEHYWIYVWNKDADELVYNTILNSPSEIQVTSLDPYHNYNCSVAAFARGGLGPFTTANTWLTDQADTSAPINLKPLKTGSEFVHLHWLEPHTRHQNTTILHYKITIHSIENKTAEFPVQETSYNMTSLHPNYHYTITVVAVTLNTIGPNATINIQTEEDIPSDAPQNLRSTKVTPHSITLKWEAPPLPSQNGDIIGYTIQVLREDNATGFMLSTGEFILTVTDLDDDTSYNFSVAAKTSIGAGPFSVHVTAKTKNYALEVTMYSLIGFCLVLVLVAIMGSCIVYCCCRSKLKQCTSKWLTNNCKGSKSSINVDQGRGNDYNLRMRASRDGKQQTPELPDREYLEDIDFVSKEFDLFFKRRPDLPTRMDDNLVNEDNKNETEEKELSCSEEQSASIEKPKEEASHYMPLKITKEGGQSSESAYESLKPRKQQPTAYVNVKLKEESSARSHYEPLRLAKHEQESKDPSSQYQPLKFNAKST